MLLCLGTTAASDTAHPNSLRKRDVQPPHPFLPFPQTQEASVPLALILITNNPVKLRCTIIFIFHTPDQGSQQVSRCRCYGKPVA